MVSYKLFQQGTVFKDFTDVQAEESEFSNIGAMCKSDQNEDTFSVYFDELEHNFTEIVQKQQTWGISHAREISRLSFKKMLLEICLMHGSRTE